MSDHRPQSEQPSPPPYPSQPSPPYGAGSPGPGPGAPAPGPGPTGPVTSGPGAPFYGPAGPPPGNAPYGRPVAPGNPGGFLPPPGPYPAGGPFGQPGPGSSRPPRRAAGIVAAAAVIGALAGGAAGVGGAALMDNSTGSGSASTATHEPLQVGDKSSAGGGNQTAAAAADSQTIEAAASTALPSVVKIYGSGQVGSGSGSGIILTQDGEILTNNHVAELGTAGGKLAVSFNDGTTARATILGRDPFTDLAVIQADSVGGLTAATLGNSDSLSVGEQVVAVGSPFGLESTVTTGIVSALNRPVSTKGEVANDPKTVFPAIQTDAAINPGNSGGPLIDTSGQVIGINSAIQTTSSTPNSQGGSIGLGFAIPINDAVPIVEQLRNGETPTHARIGVSVTNASDRIGLPDGALVTEVSAGTAAADAGMRKGDVITKVDDQLVTDANSLVATIGTYRPDDTVTLTLASSTPDGTSTGNESTVDLTLGSDAG